MKNFKQYLEEALRSEVNTDRHIGSGLMGISQERYTPGIARRVITALGGSPISAANAKKVASANKAGEDKTKREREEGDAAVLRYKKRASDDAATSRKLSEDSGERAGGPEDGNTGYGLPRKNSRFYPAKNPRPTGPGTEYHMETILKKIEARKAAEAAAAAAEAAKSAGEQEPEHWRDFPTDVRYDQYGDQD